MPKSIGGVAEQIKDNCRILHIRKRHQLFFEKFDIRLCNHPAWFGEINDNSTIGLEDWPEACKVTCFFERLYNSTVGLPVLLRQNKWIDHGNI
jgi:hypothetical protein